jgi:hypothetical protein
MHCVSVTKLAGGLKNTILLQERVNLVMVSIVELRSQVGRPEIRPQYVVLEEFPVLPDGPPVTTFDIGIDLKKGGALRLEIGLIAVGACGDSEWRPDAKQDD